LNCNSHDPNFDGQIIRASASSADGHWFDLRPNHVLDFKTDYSYSLLGTGY